MMITLSERESVILYVIIFIYVYTSILIYKAEECVWLSVNLNALIIGTLVLFEKFLLCRIVHLSSITLQSKGAEQSGWNSVICNTLSV